MIPQLLPNKAIAQHFSNAASTYDAHAIFQNEIGQRLIERLDWFHLNPKYILDVGSGTGLLVQLLKQRFPKATIIGLDIAFGMTQFAKTKLKGKFWESTKHHFLCADAHALPLKPHQFDLIVSNCTLQWCDPAKTFSQLKIALKPEGLLLFSSLGPDTFKELRSSFQSVDRYQHVHSFIDMHDVGDQLLQVGFSDPVMDMESLTMTYRDLKQLYVDLKKTGASNLHVQRRPSLMGKSAWHTMQQHYSRYMTDKNCYPATIEVIYGHAFHPARIPTKITCSKT